MELADGIVMINKYKDSKHFVMDACLYPSDSSHFFTASLDGKIRMYSVASNKLLKVFKGHEKGVNSVCFINPETFVTGSDDCTVMVWDVRRPLPVAVLRGHTKNVNTVKPLKSGFASCSEDSTVRFWNNEFKTVDILNMQGRVWDLYVKEGKIFVGSDEELSVFQELSSSPTAALRENKIFYNIGSEVFSVKVDELGAYKELGTLDGPFEYFVSSPNGKLIAVVGNLEINVYSVLGMRKKYSDSGRDLCFIDTDRFVYLKDSDVVFVSRNEVETKMHLDINRLLYSNTKKMIANAKKTALYSIDSRITLVHEFDITVQKAIIVNEHFILFGDQIHIFNAKLEEVGVLEHRVENFIDHDGILIFSTVNMTFYLILDGDKVHLSHLKHYGQIIGIKDKTIFYTLMASRQTSLTWTSSALNGTFSTD
ncbi:uncharacterized protein VICG_02027 [Vittaforma corneae ATCC 50505]|uniref:COPA/B second beta-propeller domain-containing protein n=1 Tax=Vittaforma corneae (strain ATCC 50505) TaxID=993615 RepID=L2GJ82_VITCO|nr:uncharacterized protein VICG_02027 [Vittaforma corneae ATCC 50505]ELA40938.1 hypothetical protein VICG_02027 [Vittaforma corneae ATCC 50505]